MGFYLLGDLDEKVIDQIKNRQLLEYISINILNTILELFYLKHQNIPVFQMKLK